MKRILTEGSVPSSLNKACVVANFKKGDVRDANMYRGISLIEILLKIFTAVITSRIHTALQADSSFAQEQGGFRPRKECVGQYSALREALLRRRSAGLRSLVFFSDFRKAFDTVSHIPMIGKLIEAGVPLTYIDFFRALHDTATIAVRTQIGTSQFVNFSKDVRQGCPGSPLAFLVFINDLFDECKQQGIGVDIPGVPQLLDYCSGLDINLFYGLLFADDAVHVCGNVEDMRRTLRELDKWTRLWGLSYGINKCGIIDVRPLNMTEDPLPDLLLNGSVVPVVNKYTYLGLILDNRLSLIATVSGRVNEAHKNASVVTRMVGNKSIPIGLRIAAWRAMVVPAITYGGEVLGLHARSSSLLRPLRNLLVGSLSALVKGSWTLPGDVTKARPPMHVSSDVLFLEFLGCDLHSIMAGMRARVIAKFPTTKSCMCILTQYPAPKSHAYGECWDNIIAEH